MRRLVQDFARQRDGNVLMLFGLLVLPLLGFTGAAIDYGLATRLETKLQAATDATALALCQTPMATTTSELQVQALNMMTGYMGNSGLVVDPLGVTPNPRQITLNTHVASPVFFGRVTGVTNPRPAASARCATPIPKTFEIALVLDNTGSMGRAGDDGVSKMDALQQAAKNFVNYVFTNPSFASGTKISIVPFAASVAINPATYRYATWIDQNGKSAYHWNNVRNPSGAGFSSRFDIFDSLKSTYSGWGWGGCLETLPYPQNVQDGYSGSNNLLYVPLLAPDEPGDANQNGIVSNGNNANLNSYLNDSTSSASCQPLPNNTDFPTLESRACKYKNPTGWKATNSGSITGIPNGPNFGCTSQPLQRLTSDQNVLTSLINKMNPLGATNIHEGFMWGWRTLSPTSVFGDGSPYSSSTANKIIVLMTDGANSWSVNPYYGNYGYTNYNISLYQSMGYFKNSDAAASTPNSRLPPGNQNVSTAGNARDALDALTLEACGNAKSPSNNISVYTIGFSVSSDPIDSQGKNLLQKCATTPAQYFLANDSNSLITAFSQIAASIGTLRLTQ